MKIIKSSGNFKVINSLPIYIKKEQYKLTALNRRNIKTF
jgi:hypothetical protein